MRQSDGPAAGASSEPAVPGAVWTTAAPVTSHRLLLQGHDVENLFRVLGIIGPVDKC